MREHGTQVIYNERSWWDSGDGDEFAFIGNLELHSYIPYHKPEEEPSEPTTYLVYQITLCDISGEHTIKIANYDVSSHKKAKESADALRELAGRISNMADQIDASANRIVEQPEDGE
jgi:hypothetical protein